MFCSQCGTELINGACPNCTPEEPRVEEQEKVEPDYVEIKTPVKKKPLVLAIICMATGIASIIWGLGIVGGIAALITGTLYKKKAGESHTMVKVGSVCGVIGIIIWALAIVALILYYVIVYAFLFALLFQG